VDNHLEELVIQNSQALQKLQLTSELQLEMLKDLKVKYDSAFDNNNPDSVISRLADVETQCQVVDAKVSSKKSGGGVGSPHFTPERIVMSLVLSMSLITNAFLAAQAPQPVQDLMKKTSNIGGGDKHMLRSYQGEPRRIT
jgi:hypothetical protein